MSCKGLHCPGCGDGPWAVLAVIIGILVVGAAVAKPVMHAADELLHWLLVAVAVLAGLSVTAAAGYGAYRLRRRYAHTRIAMRIPPEVTPAARRVLELELEGLPLSQACQAIEANMRRQAIEGRKPAAAVVLSRKDEAWNRR